MKKNKPLYVYMLLDASGSMFEHKDGTISAINEYVNSVSRNEKGKVFFSLRTFNSLQIVDIYNNVPIKQVKPFTNKDYNPDFITPLYDAIGNKIQEVKSFMSSIKNDGKVLFVIVTDGLENSSYEWSREKVFDQIKELETKCPQCDYGLWTFAFLGANQDSWAEGRKIGISKGNVCDFNMDLIGETLRDASMCTSSLADSKLGSTINFFKPV